MICEETGLSKYKILRALSLIRQCMAKDIPEIFEGIVEVDETYLGGQKKNKRKSQLKKDKEALAPPNSLFLGSWLGMGKSMLNWWMTLKQKT